MSWGIQKFLNPPGHDDSGFLVAHIGDTGKRRWRGFTATLTVADCDRRAHLDFSPQDYDSDGENKGSIEESLKSIKDRRDKIKVLRNVVNTFCDKMEAKLDKFEVEVKDFKKAIKTKE